LNYELEVKMLDDYKYVCLFFQVLGDTLAVSQSSVSRAVEAIVSALVDRADEFIYLPTEEEVPSVCILLLTHCFIFGNMTKMPEIQRCKG